MLSERPTRTDEAFERALRQLFIDDTLPRLQALRQALAGRDAEAVARQAHCLVGGCQQVGASEMVTASKKLVQIVGNDNLQGAEALVARLEAEFEKIRKRNGRTG